VLTVSRICNALTAHCCSSADTTAAGVKVAAAPVSFAPAPPLDSPAGAVRAGEGK
jgi:hypothetical protein